MTTHNHYGIIVTLLSLPCQRFARKQIQFIRFVDISGEKRVRGLTLHPLLSCHFRYQYHMFLPLFLLYHPLCCPNLLCHPSVDSSFFRRHFLVAQASAPPTLPSAVLVLLLLTTTATYRHGSEKEVEIFVVRNQARAVAVSQLFIEFPVQTGLYRTWKRNES